MPLSPSSVSRVDGSLCSTAVRTRCNRLPLTEHVPCACCPSAQLAEFQRAESPGPLFPTDLDFIGSAITFCSLGQMAGILDEIGEWSGCAGGAREEV